MRMSLPSFMMVSLRLNLEHVSLLTSIDITDVESAETVRLFSLSSVDTC
jgi:hypothetical protein